DLAWARVAAGEPARGGELALDHGKVTRRRRSQLEREGGVTGGLGDLGQAGVDVGRLRRHQVRLRHLQELCREVVPVAGAAGDVLPVRPGAYHVLQVEERKLEVVRQRGRRGSPGV